MRNCGPLPLNSIIVWPRSSSSAVQMSRARAEISSLYNIVFHKRHLGGKAL